MPRKSTSGIKRYGRVFYAGPVRLFDNDSNSLEDQFDAVLMCKGKLKIKKEDFNGDFGPEDYIDVDSYEEQEYKAIMDGWSHTFESLAKFLAPRGKIKVKSVEVTLPDSVICDNSHGQPQTGAKAQIWTSDITIDFDDIAADRKSFEDIAGNLRMSLSNWYGIN